MNDGKQRNSNNNNNVNPSNTKLKPPAVMQRQSFVSEDICMSDAVLGNSKKCTKLYIGIHTYICMYVFIFMQKYASHSFAVLSLAICAGFPLPTVQGSARNEGCALA